MYEGALALIGVGLCFLFLSSKYPHTFSLLLNSIISAVIVYTLLHYFYPHSLYQVVYPGSLLSACLTSLISLFWPIHTFSLAFCLVITFGGTFLALPWLGSVWSIVVLVPISFSALLMAYYWHSHLLIWSTSSLGAFFLVSGIHGIQSLTLQIALVLGLSWMSLGVVVQYLLLQKDDDPSKKEEREETLTYQQLNKILAA